MSSIGVSSEIIPALLEKHHGPLIVIDIDFAQSQILLLKNDKIHFSRNISIGTKTLSSENISSLSEFVSEIASSISLFPIEHEKQITPILLMGAPDGLNILTEPLRNHFKTKVEKMAFSPKIDNLTTAEFSSKISLTSVLCFMRNLDDDVELNLLPPDIAKIFESRIFHANLKKAAALTLVTVVLGAGSFNKEISSEGKYLESLKGQTQSIEKTALELEMIKGKLLILKDQIEHRSHCLDIITSLFKDIPSDIHLKNLSYDSKKLNLKGYASSLSEVFNFVTLLEKNSYFEKVETKYARQSSEARQELAEFDLQCLLAIHHSSEKQND